MTKFSSRRTKKHQTYSIQHEVNRDSNQINNRLSTPKQRIENREQEIKNDNTSASNLSVVKEDSNVYNDVEKPVLFNDEQIEQENILPESYTSERQLQNDLTDKIAPSELDIEDVNYDVYDNKKVLQQIIQNYYQKKKYLECISQLEKILKSKPSNLECVYWLAMCCYQLGQLAEATEYFVQASFCVETEEICYVESFFWLGEIYRQQKELKIASENYQKFLALAPKSLHSPAASKYLSEIKFELMFNSQ